LPTEVEALTPEWLAARLREAGVSGAGAITRVSATRIAKGESLFGRLHRLALELEPATAAASDAPRSLICKLPTRGGFNALAVELRLYERECRFYQELAAHCPLATPRAYVAEFRGDDRALLLLDDLAGLQSHDQLRGMPAAAALSALASLAPFHAKYWNGAGVPDWVPVIGELPGHAAMRAATAAGFGRVVDVTPQLWTASRRAMFEGYLSGTPPVPERLAQAPHTLLHGDFRSNNLFFRADGGVVVIDWQGMGRGRGAYDVGYLLSQSLTTDSRRGLAEDPVATYHRALLEAGVTGYALEECLVDVAAGIVLGIAVVVMANSAARSFSAEMAHFLGTMLGRALDCAEDYRAAERLGLPG